MQNAKCSSLATSPRSPAPSGVTLLEVLVSVFVITLGLLGVAALIPLGRLAISETNIADRTGTLGRAALRDVEVRRMLDYRYLFPTTYSTAYVIDPLGYVNGLTGALGVPRLGVRQFPDEVSVHLTSTQADAIFRGQDDLPFVPSEDPTDPNYNGERPVLAGVSEGNFSWFITVCPSRSDWALNIPVAMRRDYDVSVVVCHKRNFTTTGETTMAVTNFLGGGYGGGTVQVGASVANIVETDQWVMLAANDNSTAKWYRVVGVADAGANHYLSLVGPDWDTTNYPTPTLVIVEGVTGVYTTNIHLDNDCTWTR